MLQSVFTAYLISILTCNREINIIQLLNKYLSICKHNVREAVSLLTLDENGDSRLYYHSQSSPRMKPGGRDNRWARWGLLACPAHPRGAHSQSSQPGLKTQCWKTVLLKFY